MQLWNEKGSDGAVIGQGLVWVSGGGAHVQCNQAPRTTRILDLQAGDGGVFQRGRLIVAYHTLPLMRSDRRPAEWDKWGWPWALMDIAQEHVPRNRKVWRRAHTPGRVLVAVLVRHDEELYYFPDAPALLRTLHQNAKAEGDVAAHPGAQGWSARELK